MKKTPLSIYAAAWASLLLLSPLARAETLGTAFTYEGHLMDAGSPASGNFNMTFALFDAATLGDQVGPTLVFDGAGGNPPPVAVANGLFTVSLDFGGVVFQGDKRWLEITVSSTTLSPRQPLTPTPYALALPAMRVEQNATSPNVIGGHGGNSVTESVVGATIAGGGSAVEGTNLVTDEYGTIGGGRNNQAGDNEGATTDRPYSTVGGGAYNLSAGYVSTVAGGFGNTATDLSTVGGGYANSATGGTWLSSPSGSTVGGGESNNASGLISTVAGGALNNASGDTSTVGGGNGNIASGTLSTIGGGALNTASGIGSSTVAGGVSNNASGDTSTVGGGEGNTASGMAATVPGGSQSEAAGDYSFATGRRANANHAGAFVWGDNTDAEVTSSADNQFTARCSGGVQFFTDADLTTGVEVAAGSGAWSSLSDRNVKDHFKLVSVREVLDRVAAMPISTWNYKRQDASIRHIGPMAQDFKAAFGVGEDDKHITTVDADGVALAAIQGLHQMVQEKNCEIAELQVRLDRLEAKLTSAEMKTGGTR